MKPTVLLVDDEPNILNTYTRGLRCDSYQLLTAQNAEQALLILNELKDSVFLVVSDHMMPGMTGTELLTYISVMYPDIQLILMTAYASLENALKCINEVEVVRYLQKPVLPDSLHHEIVLALKRKDSSSVKKQKAPSIMLDFKLQESDDSIDLSSVREMRKSS